MGIFTRFLTRELGKNTGKVVSNLIYGDSWSTPHKLIRNQNKKETDRIKRRNEFEAKYQESMKHIMQLNQLERQKKKNKNIGDSEDVESLVKQIERLKTLVDDGYMTKREFEKAKRNILSKLEK